MAEPSLDLGIVMAVVSSYKDISLPEKTLVFGEVGLTGELRSVTQPLLRVREAMKLGYRACILSQSDCESIRDKVPSDVKLYGLRHIGELKK